ncbi:F1F0 ATP synthase subunit k Ecym_5318 [Eremothecium cymbalariae DBVPG|uniref:ATP synthase subunit K, mitochondrial n=1 Tax=Eremothecium cymbalariae (strain CBS 270.75 / DBVPG 7215 / KCTC 17166 / NRRL Y-17582) TaxID=931890 RepID=I6NDD6_ERECY|nr:hypothetical protein Ecym_5318 [Eremothecium cymbalariae DBVPG\
MGAAYTILGRTFKPHQLALGTISAVLLLVVPNPFKKSEPKSLWKASSHGEEKYIEEYLAKHAEKL